MVETRTESSQTIRFRKGDIDLSYEMVGSSTVMVMVHGANVGHNINPNVRNVLDIDIISTLAAAFASMCDEER